ERGERIKAVIENIRTRSKKLKKKALVPATKKVSEPKEKEKMIAERHSQELQLIKLQRFFCKLGEAEHKQMFGASVERACNHYTYARSALIPEEDETKSCGTRDLLPVGYS
ncbi:hypothetical protein MAR_001702, partial [Mya arenaria]